MNPAKRGDVWLVDLGQPKEDHEQAGPRPAIISKPMTSRLLVRLTFAPRDPVFEDVWNFAERPECETKGCFEKYGGPMATETVEHFISPAQMNMRNS